MALTKIFIIYMLSFHQALKLNLVGVALLSFSSLIYSSLYLNFSHSLSAYYSSGT